MSPILLASPALSEDGKKGSGGGAAAVGKSAQTRTLHFDPAGAWPIGRLYIQRAPGARTGATPIGPALGTIVVPANASVALMVSVEGAEDMRPLSHLGANDLQAVWLHNTLVTSKDMKNLTGLKGLRELYCDQTDLDGEALLFIGQLDSLEALRIQRTQVTDRNLDVLAKMKHLKNLMVNSNDITDGGARALSASISLTHLSVAFTHVTDKCCDYFVQMKQLKSLNLADNTITDAGILKLSKLKGLQHLNVSHTFVTKAGIANFQRMLPGCKVEAEKLRPDKPVLK